MRKTTSIIICIITVVVAIASWNFLFNSLYGLEEGWFGIWIKPMIGFMVLMVLLSLISLLVESKKIIIPTFLVTSFSFFLIFSFNRYVLLALVLFLGMLFLSRARIRDELKVRLKIRIGRVLQKGLPLVLTSLVLVISVSYCFTPSSQKIEIKIPQKFLERLQEPLMKIISPKLPGLGGFDLGMTVDEFLIKSALEKEGIDPNLLKDPRVKAMVEKEIRGLREKFSEQFQIDIKGNQKISEAVSEIIDTKIEEFTKPYKKYIPLALAISLFLFLRIVAIPVGWLIILLSWIVFKLLVAFKVVRIEKVPKEAEIIKM